MNEDSDPTANRRRSSVAVIGTRGYPSYYGGFETAVRRLAPYLVDRGWDVTVYSRRGQTNYNDPRADMRVRTVTTWGWETRALSTLTYGWSSTRHAAAHRPDVALVMNVANGFWLPSLRRRGIPTVVNVDGIEWDRDKWNRLGKSVFHAGARATAKHANRLVVDSREIGRRWQEEFGREGDYIPYGGDITPSLPIEPGLQHRGYALYVARFVPENTIDEFLLAADRVGREVDVVIVGSSGYGGELDARASSLADRNPRVKWLGHVSDDTRLASLWQHAGAYFHGHSVGGTNPALVQAMACGAPTVARDTVYNREVLGGAGVLTDPHPESIAQNLLSLIGDSRRQDSLSSASRTRAASNYSWANVCRAYEDALSYAIAGRDSE